jgi:hypothetical protein
MKPYRCDLISDAGVPLVPIPFYFCQFRHAGG